MLVSFQDNVVARRILTLRDYAWVIVQPLAPNAVRIATTKQEAENVIGNGADGLQVNASVVNSDIFQVRWKGELWIIAVNPGANTQCIVLVPGLQPFSAGLG